MKIEVKREEFTDKSTIGRMYVNGVFECYTLEDKDRKLEAGGQKVYGLTSIPRGSYTLIMSFSNRFQKYLPEILNVPQFEGIRIHGGNSDVDSHGCILVGQTKVKDFIGNSRAALAQLLTKIKSVEKKEKITITIS